MHAGNLSSNILFMAEGNSLATCQAMWDYGIPCWVDTACPQGDKLAPAAEAGFTVMFLDNDAIVMGDPYQGIQPERYHLEAMSDWVKQIDLPDPLDSIRKTPDCIYKITVNRPGAEDAQGRWVTGSQYLEATNDPTQGHAITPCWSTGLWFAHPHTPVSGFFRDLLQRLIEQEAEWDQAAAQEVLLGHMMNLNSNPDPLRFRLLPHDQYTNLKVYQDYARAGLATQEIVLHPCCTTDKVGDLKKAHLWQADAWQPSWGEEIVLGFQACLAERNGALCTAHRGRDVYALPNHAPREYHADCYLAPFHQPQAIV
ncbi:hypothetical protein WJX73_008441 [Symbiochloris irregularis]|uniref:Nucleotide-diphospho-sugar transferase domain-containing protein n=1 Tax=Symbiochloris irregularis TaxID=706552 RepID=A0AAW1PA65_9CHLO